MPLKLQFHKGKLFYGTPGIKEGILGWLNTRLLNDRHSNTSSGAKEGFSLKGRFGKI